jgi:PleD family two-component response regulator
MNAVQKLGTHFSLDTLDSLVNKVKKGVERAAEAMTMSGQRFRCLRSLQGAYAQLAALQAENAALAQENAALKCMAYTDDLTGLPNRRAFIAAAKMEQAQRTRGHALRFAFAKNLACPVMELCFALR